ncbi:MAG: hypothetical protein QW063_01255 [Candidatus Nanoarchaeia archaeon]
MPKAKAVTPKEIAVKEVKKLKRDVFIFIWIIFIAVLIVMTKYFKQYVKGMIVISLLFVIFWYFEPFLFGATGKTVTTYLSRGQKVPKWKRFPLFFLVIILLYIIYSGIQIVLNWAFPAESVNIVFVALWIGFLFLLWNYKFSNG